MEAGRHCARLQSAAWPERLEAQGQRKIVVP
jgi:hypothetical protein